ncbi:MULTISPECIES: tetratricopeptide repeat protein [unclassified Pseudoalteromonas]|uniref:tetratricopeptide repeat protein n=1 Tax=unclassified Pseudoalteromonas TaxID=194690 RepID=UPI000693CD1B|nr:MULTISPECIES: tetratricopeptide repeat protein [unclassified Pseudoalteromonas]
MSHGLTSAAGAFHAYQNLFLPIRMPNKALIDGVASINDYYSRLSMQRDENIKPPEWVIRELGYHLVNIKQEHKAVEIFKFNLKSHPDLASAYNGLAYIYERLNRYDEALQHINKALTLATKKDSGYQVYISRKNRLTAQVSGTNKAQLK